MKQQFDITVRGRVQGVGFRAAARKMARSLGLKGWVENLPDGSVRALINGGSGDCNLFIAWCRSGTGFSWVEDVDIKEMESESLEAFSIRY
jgi:acylphosphatase